MTFCVATIIATNVFVSAQSLHHWICAYWTSLIVPRIHTRMCPTERTALSGFILLPKVESGQRVWVGSLSMAAIAIGMESSAAGKTPMFSSQSHYCCLQTSLFSFIDCHGSIHCRWPTYSSSELKYQSQTLPRITQTIVKDILGGLQLLET